VLTSNKAFSEWGQVLSADVLAAAILDRLLHHSDVVVPPTATSPALGSRRVPLVLPVPRDRYLDGAEPEGHRAPEGKL
jgi:hypothetical protein